ncbi:MAG: heavy metal translocating P-type ATPase [Phycisphaeraceae bacterium]
MNERIFRVHGLCCGSEVKTLKQEVGPRVGGEQNLAFDILQSRMTVLVDAEQASDERVIEAVRRAGLDAELWESPRPTEPPGFWHRHGRAVLAAASGALLVLAFVLHAVLAGDVLAALAGEGGVPLPSVALYVMSIVAGVWYVLPRAWSALKALRPDMNLLMTIAVAGAVLIGEWFEAATVAFLFATALLLESWSVGRARRAVQSLLEAAPPMARIKRDGQQVEVRPEQVDVGTSFIVRPGEKIPLDGEVIAGQSDVDQAPITGESVPAAKQPGEAVYAGTINGDGLLEVRSTKPADQTTLASIIRLVTQAQSRRAPSEQWVEKFARIYTPAVLMMAMAIFLTPPLLLGGAWSEWFYRALVLLVIACPCALVISTPVSIVAALTRSAREGVLVKGGLFMEAPARLQAIAFDKTGTLTEGRPQVAQLIPLNGHSEDDLLQRAAALEAGSNHPLALAVVAAARQRGIAPPPADAHQAMPGKGVTGRIDGKLYWLGSHRYLEERQQETPAIHEQLEALSDAGHSVIAVGTADHVCGLIALADRPRPQARETIAALHRLGIHHTAMLTGDNHATANAIARELGIDHVHAELLPEHKVETVEALVREHGRVAMVGDGVNDAPALAVSSLGIAMGAAGSDAAIETADIALMADDLTKLPWAVGHSRRTLNIIHQNIAFALGLKVVFVTLTLFGLATLWMAIAADMGASLVVIFNGLRLLRNF